MVIINTAPAILELATTPTVAPFPPPAVGLASSEGWSESVRWVVLGSGITLTLLLIIVALTFIVRQRPKQSRAPGRHLAHTRSPAVENDAHGMAT
jgi:hypothetical protein